MQAAVAAPRAARGVPTPRPPSRRPVRAQAGSNGASPGLEAKQAQSGAYQPPSKPRRAPRRRSTPACVSPLLPAGTLFDLPARPSPRPPLPCPAGAADMLEMFVADDLLLHPGAPPGARQPVKRLVPAPHKASPKLAARPGSPPPPMAGAAAPPQQQQQLNGSSPAGLNGAVPNGLSGTPNGLNGNGNGGALSVQEMVAKRALERAEKAASAAAAAAELGLVKRQATEQLVELRDVKEKLA